ncbi:MAG: DNA methyltransferase [archaeon]
MQTLDFKKAVTFIPNKKEPIYNWYYFKEGFSKQLVDYFLEKYSPKRVLDPFCGVGTTLLACKQKEIDGAGLDVSSLAVFVAKVKTANYDINVIKQLFEKFKEKHVGEKIKTRYKSYFPKYVLDIGAGYLSIIESFPQPYQDFFKLALMDSMMKCSYAFKDGAVLKRFKRPLPPFKLTFRNKVKKMIKDLEKMNLPKIVPEIIQGDARNMPFEDESFDLVITSPPYLNKIEYTQVYGPELEIFFKLPETKLRSYIGEDIKKTYEKYLEFPPAAQAYFSDLEKSLQEIYRVLQKNGHMVLVIGGGCFPDRAIDVPEQTKKICEEIGFLKIEEIVARKFWCFFKRIKVGQVSESILVYQKPF